MVKELIDYLEDIKKEHGKNRPYYTFSDDRAKLNRIIRILREVENDNKK